MKQSSRSNQVPAAGIVPYRDSEVNNNENEKPAVVNHAKASDDVLQTPAEPAFVPFRDDGPDVASDVEAKAASSRDEVCFTYLFGSIHSLNSSFSSGH